MRKIVHLPDSSFYSELISALDFDDDTLIYNELTDEMFRYVKPIDVNQTFEVWKDNLPKYSYQHFGNMVPSVGFGDLSLSYSLYDTDAIFGSELSSYFMLNVNVYWQKKIGGSSNDYGNGIAVDVSGNVYLNGYQDSDLYGGTYDFGVIKLDSDGNLLWQKKIGGISTDQGYAIAVDGSGNVYLNGAQASDVYGGSFDYGVIKLDTNGNILWQKKIGGSGGDYGRAIAVDVSGNVYLNGYQASDSYGGNDYGVIKLDTNGNLLWQKKIGGINADIGYAIAVDGSGNVYLNGQQASDSYGGNDYGVIKLDTNGNILWQKKIGGSSTDSGRAIAVDGSGNVYLNGYQASDSYGGNDYGVIKLDSDGNLLWQKKIGGSSNNYGYAIAVDGSGNVYLNGYQSSDSYGSFDYGVIKLDTNGNILWQKKIGGISTDNGYAIAVDVSGNVYLNGQQASDVYGGPYDYGVMKLYTDQESDMNLSIGDMSLSTGNMNLSIGTMSLSIGDMNLSIGDMNLSIGDIDMSGEVGGGLVYIG